MIKWSLNSHPANTGLQKCVLDRFVHLMKLLCKTAHEQNDNRGHSQHECELLVAPRLTETAIYCRCTAEGSESRGMSLYLRHPNQIKLISYEHDEQGLGINPAGWERTEQCRQSEALTLPSAVCCCWMSSLRFRQNPAFNEGTWPTHFPE